MEIEKDQVIDDAKAQELSHIKDANEGDKDGELKLQVTTCNQKVKISIEPPKGQQRTPIDVCCIVDTSGSMGTLATIKKEGGNNEQDGLTILDLVKHSVKTIVENLTDRDNLSLVRYDDQAEIIFKLKKMDENGRKIALKKVEELCLGGCTNLWDGLKTGLDTMQKDTFNRNKQIMLFTDGLPNVVPPRGHIPMLKNYIDEQKVECSINTYGFGYSLDSELLNEIAHEGKGTYNFIPDSGFIGTIFVNSLSNMLCTYANNVVVSIEPMNNATIPYKNNEIPGYICHGATWGCHIMLGSVQFDQKRDIVFNMDLSKFQTPKQKEENPEQKEQKSFIYVKVNYQLACSGKAQWKNIGKEAQDNDCQGDWENIEAQELRVKIIQGIKDGMMIVKKDKIDIAQNVINELKDKIQETEVYKNEKNKYVQDLFKDIDGQVTEAFSRGDWYNKWGKHYLPSLSCAHLMQQANNFKDPGVQHYGGPLFEKLRTQVETAFLKLPPPKPTGAVYQNVNVKPGKHGSGKSFAARPVNMKSHYCSSAPCFAQDSWIMMADGGRKLVQDVKQGDLVKGVNDGEVQEIECVVKTVSFQGKMNLVTLENGLKITPYHPVKSTFGVWNFPIDLGKENEEKCEAVYSFLFRDRHEGKSNEICVNGIQAATFAHHLDGNVIGHDYFGTEKIVQDLKKMQGWDMGLVLLQAGCLVKCEKSGLVKALQQQLQQQEQN